MKKQPTENKPRRKLLFENLSIRSQMLIGYIVPVGILVIALIVLGFFSVYDQNAGHVYNYCDASITQMDFLVQEYVTQVDRTTMTVYNNKEVFDYLRGVTKSVLYQDKPIDSLNSDPLYVCMNGMLNTNADLYSVSIVDSNNKIYTSCKSGRPLDVLDFSDSYYDSLKHSSGEMVLLSKANRKNISSDDREVFAVGRRLLDNGSNSLGTYVGYVVAECEVDSLGELIDGLRMDEDFRFQINIGGEVLYTHADEPVLSDAAVKEVAAMTEHQRQYRGFMQEMYLYKENAVSNGYVAGVIDAPMVLHQMVPVMIQFVVFSLGSILVVLVISAVISKKIVSPIKALEKAMISFESPEDVLEVQPLEGNEFSHLRDTFNKMVLRLNAQSRNLMVLSEQNKEAQLKALYSQIKPHFLYNTLESIRMMAVMKEHQKVADSIKALGDIFRYSTSNKDNVVQVADEVKHMTDYFRLQKLSFGERVELLCDIEAGLLEGKILRFVLQPLVENSLKHGLAKTKKDGLIRVSAHKEGNAILFCIQDNGVGMAPESIAAVYSIDPEDSKESIGLRNINMRMKLLFGQELQIESAPGAGTTVRFYIPQ